MTAQNQSLPFKKQLKLVITLCLLLALIEVINTLSARALNHYGLIPRNINGLMGIVSSVFLHGSLVHFLSNIVPFALFSFLLLQHGTKRYIQVTLICIVATGLLVWLFGRNANHIGASGLIYGYFGYLLLAGFMAKKAKLMLISLFVGITYGTLVLGVLPTTSYISWESHLFGLVVGLICAYKLNK
ncbi:rhomboid family intramembrane serine protease [Gammaproteobacteria bacterium AS21]